MLKSLVYKGEFRGFKSFQETPDLGDQSRKPDIIFTNISIGREKISKGIARLRSERGGDKFKVIVCLDGRFSSESTAVVGLFLEGIDGFISEPFSMDHIQALLVAITKKNNEVHQEDRALRSLEFLLKDATQHIDKLAFLMAEGGELGGYAYKEMQTISATLKDMYKQHPEEYSDIIARVFEACRAPKERIFKKTAAKKAIPLHPGITIRKTLAERLFSVERLAQIIRCEIGDLQAIIDCKSPVTSEIASGLARALGRTSREWMSMQSDFDSYQEKMTARVKNRHDAASP